MTLLQNYPFSPALAKLVAYLPRMTLLQNSPVEQAKVRRVAYLPRMTLLQNLKSSKFPAARDGNLGKVLSLKIISIYV